jgi:hypothetical protein
MNNLSKKLFLLIILGGAIIVFSGVYIFKQSQTTPKITISSPEKEEVWHTKSTHMISWETKNISTSSKISISLRRIPPPALQIEGQEFDPIVFVNLENTGNISWTISDMYPTGTYILDINSYNSIPVTDVISAESAPFKIFNPNKINETFDWGVYINNEEGYTFKYPKDWNSTTNKYNSKNSLFGPEATNESGHGGVEFLGNLSSDQSLKDFIKEFNSGIEGGSITETETLINNKNVIVSILPKASIEPIEIKSVSFEKDGKVFNMYLIYKTDFAQYPEDKDRLNTFNHMLSTFDFTY